LAQEKCRICGNFGKSEGFQVRSGGALARDPRQPGVRKDPEQLGLWAQYFASRRSARGRENSTAADVLAREPGGNRWQRDGVVR
jgi:hypothetical protein